MKFCLFTIAGEAEERDLADFIFLARQTTQLTDHERRFSLSAQDFALLNPNTRTCPIFRYRRDAELLPTSWTLFQLSGGRTNNNSAVTAPRKLSWRFDAMAKATRTRQQYESRLDPPLADSRVAHLPRSRAP
jgi:hypothetical protein